MSRARIVLAPGREAPFVGGHPWVFSGAIARIEGPAAEDGAEVDVVAADGAFIARGLFNSRSQIRARLYAWEETDLDDQFFATRIADAIHLRTDILRLTDPRGACRLVFSEGDGLSGLIVDRYGAYLSVQFTSLALAARREALVEALVARTGAEGVILRTEKGILEEEGLELRDGPLAGTVPEEPIEVFDAGLRFGVDLRTGHKTGSYLDQRENRVHAAAYARYRTIADVCSYTGGFSVATACAGAAHVTGVDSSESALALATANAERNQVAERCTFERGDAFKWLEAQADAGHRFGMVVLDPPRFARTRKGVPQALRAYERLNRLALSVIEDDGFLVTCSCSGRVSAEDFAGTLGRAAGAERRSVQILERRGQASDHPVRATCPESDYLKCLICRVS